MIRYVSRVVLAGKTRLVSFVLATVSKNEQLLVEGFLTFVHVGRDGRPLPHGIVIEAATQEEKELQERARSL